jgi:ATP-dependent protease ClpP protease subunit
MHGRRRITTSRQPNHICGDPKLKTIHIDGPIGPGPGEVSARAFKSQLPADESPITVKFHSEGGSVFEAFAIFDAIKAYRGAKSASVESMAFSAASMLLCAFDDVAISENGYIMIHSPYFDADDVSPSEQRLLANLRERLVNLYSQKTRQPIATIGRLIDQETFFDADAAMSLGIVNRIVRAPQAVQARRLPSRVLAKLATSKQGTTATARWQSAVRASGSVRAADRSNPGLRLAMLAEVNRR